MVSVAPDRLRFFMPASVAEIESVPALANTIAACFGSDRSTVCVAVLGRARKSVKFKSMGKWRYARDSLRPTGGKNEDRSRALDDRCHGLFE